VTGIACLLKLTYGNILLAKKINDPLYWDEAYDILSVSDGGFLLTVRADASLPYPEIIRLDSNANQIWAKKFITTKHSELHSSIECQNGDFVFGGTIDGILGTDQIIIRTNHFGDTIWTKKMGAPGYGSEIISEILETNDNKLMLGGATSIGAGGGDVFVTKLDFAGDTIWTRTYGTSFQDYFSGMVKTSNGTYNLTGFTNFPSGKRGAFIIKIDSTGSIIWSNVLGTYNKFSTVKIIELSNKDLLLAGSAAVVNGGVLDAVLCVTDSLGFFKSATKYGGTLYEELRDVVLMNDSTCIAAGSIINNSISYSKTLLIRQNPHNLQSCFVPNLVFNDTSIIYHEGHGFSIYQNTLTVMPKLFTNEIMPLIDSNLCINPTVTNVLDVNHNKIIVSPNPFSTLLKVTREGDDNEGVVQIFDEFGKVLKEEDFKGHQIEISTKEMSSGIYFLRIIDKNQESIYMKIIHD